MGFFSWMYADTNNNQALKIGKSAYVLCPDGSSIYEPNYMGYGTFGGCNIYELVADWNKYYLTTDNLEKPVRKSFVTEKAYCEELARYEKRCQKLKDFKTKSERYMQQKYGEDWKSDIGIDVACYDYQNASMKYPIKICLNTTKKYEELPPSKRDRNQGCS